MIKDNDIIVACDLCEHNCNKCKHTDVCDTYLEVADNVPLIRNDLFSGDIPLKDYRKEIIRLV